MLQQSKEVGDSQQCSFDSLPHPIRREPTNAALPIIKYKHNTVQYKYKQKHEHWYKSEYKHQHKQNISTKTAPILLLIVLGLRQQVLTSLLNNTDENTIMNTISIQIQLL